MMRLGIFAKIFAGTDPAVVLAKVSSAGFSAAQYNLACSGLPPMPDAIPPSMAEEICSAASTLGVAIVAVSGTYNMIHPDPAIRRQGLARLEILAASCRFMSTRLITLCTGTRDPEDQWRRHPDNDTREAWRDLVISMERAIQIADTYDIDLAIEPELDNVVNSAAKARRLLDDLDSTRVKIILDPANLFEKEGQDRQRSIVSQAIDLLADRIVMGHAKDRRATGGFIAAGQGVLDYRHYMKALARVGFDGPIVAHGLSADDAPGVAMFLRRVLGEAGMATMA